MHFHWIAAAAGVALVCASLPVLAEIRVISPDETVLVERYIETEPDLPAPAPLEQNTVLRPGSSVPEAVPLRPFRGVSGLSRYGYFISVDRKVVVVDPATRVVVRIFDETRKQ